MSSCNVLAFAQIVATPLAILGLGFWVNTTIRPRVIAHPRPSPEPDKEISTIRLLR